MTTKDRVISTLYIHLRMAVGANNKEESYYWKELLRLMNEEINKSA